MDEQKYNELRRKVLATMNSHHKKRPPKTPRHCRRSSDPEYLIPSLFAKSVMSLQSDELKEIEDMVAKRSPDASPNASPGASPQGSPGASPSASPTYKSKTLPKNIVIPSPPSPPPDDISPILRRQHRRMKTLTDEVANCLGTHVVVHEK